MNYSKAKISVVRKFRNFTVLQEEVDKEVQSLLALKAEYKNITGQELGGGGGRKDKKKEKKGKENKQEAKAEKKDKVAEKKADKDDASREIKKITR